jgi:hypothetical protein
VIAKSLQQTTKRSITINNKVKSKEEMKHCILKRKSNEREVEEEMITQKSAIEREGLVQTVFKTLAGDQKGFYNFFFHSNNISLRNESLVFSLPKKTSLVFWFFFFFTFISKV